MAHQDDMRIFPILQDVLSKNSGIVSLAILSNFALFNVIIISFFIIVSIKIIDFFLCMQIDIFVVYIEELVRENSFPLGDIPYSL